MLYIIVINICEGIVDCVNVCLVVCIYLGLGKNIKGIDWYWIDFDFCIDCGICLEVCFVEKVVIVEERYEL